MKKTIQRLIASCAIALLAACGNDSGTSTTSGGGSLTHLQTPLISSLDALFPAGKVPTDTSEAAAVERMKTMALSSPESKTENAKSGLSLSTPEFSLNTSVEKTNSFVAANAVVQPMAGAIYRPISRVQNTSLYGAYFFTIYPTERTTALSNNPNWAYEGLAFTASLVTDTGLDPVHRFRNLQNGSYLYTIYNSERADIAANYSSTFVYEGVAWYARQTNASGWKPLYRFRNLINGTYLFSAYDSERDAILANYSAVFQLEGIAYYVKEPDAVDKYVGSWSECSATGSTAPAYQKFQLTYTKSSPVSLALSAAIVGGYSDNTCNIQTHVNNAAGFTGTVTLTGTKSASGKTVDKMYTVLSNGSILGDIYYTEGRKLYTGGGATDSAGYYNSLATIPYILQ